MNFRFYKHQVFNELQFLKKNFLKGARRSAQRHKPPVAQNGIKKFFSYSGLPNSRTVSNKRTGWEICQEIINAQDLINAQAINKTNMTYKVKKRTGWEIFLKLINAQCLISSHRTDFFLKKNKRTCATIRQVRVN